MSRTLEHSTPSGAYATPAPGPVPVSVKESTPPPHENDMANESRSEVKNEHTSWPITMLAAGGSGVGLALVGGAIAGPLAALGAGVIGIIVGVLVQKPQR